MSPLPPNPYTHSPQLHPNLIIGSLQILYWLICRPTAWKNYIEHLKTGGSLWKKGAFWRVLFQGYLILPLLGYILIILIFWAMGELREGVILKVTIGMTVGAVTGVLIGIMTGVTAGLVYNVVTGKVGINVATGIAGGIALGIAGGIALGAGIVEEGIAGSVAGIIVYGVATSMAIAVTTGMMEGVVYGLAGGVVVGLAGGVVVGIAGGVEVALVSCVSIIIFFYRSFWVYPFFIFWHILIYKIDRKRSPQKPSLLRYNAAFLDEYELLPLRGLDKHLLLILERNPTEGQAALNYLLDTRQKWAAQAAQLELEFRKLERCQDIISLSQVHQILAESIDLSEIPPTLLPKGKLKVRFDAFKTISEDVNSALNQTSVFNQRTNLENTLGRLTQIIPGLTLSNNKYAPRLSSIARRWQEIIEDKIKELRELVEYHQEIDNPYIFGVPLNEQVQLFMGRTSIALKIEKLIIDSRRPPILLYGQRRMGKTSLLNNLGKLLPNSIIPLFVDLQGPVSSSSDRIGLLYNIARQMQDSAKRQNALKLPPLTREILADDPFTRFDEWLDRVEDILGEKVVLLSLDEFEALDSAITKKRVDEEDILGYLRHLIQHRQKFKIMIAGSHTLEEFGRWASYLINVQVCHVSYLQEEEARKLIEHPIPEFTLRYEPEAVERVLQITRCHPCLVQLLCSEIVNTKNEHPTEVRRLATLKDIEAAIPEALQTGSFFFADIEANQIDKTGLKILHFIAQQGEGTITDKNILKQKFGEELEPALDLLLRRELIEPVEQGYCFQVELIRRWFVEPTTRIRYY